MNAELFKIATRNLQRRRLRSALTMLGIFIGIATIVSIISLGNGLEKAVLEEFQSLGTDKIFIEPRGQGGAPGTDTTTAKLRDRDVREVEGVLGVKDSAGMLFRSLKVEYDDVVRYTTAFGIPTDERVDLVMEAFDMNPQLGRDLKQGDRAKAVAGHLYLGGDLFEGKNLKLRDKVLLNDKEFKIVGFFETFGNTVDDQTFTIPAEEFEDLYGITDEWSMIIARVDGDPNQVAERIEKQLRKSRGVEEGKEDFSVSTAEEFLGGFTDILNIIQVFLGGIAAISLIVGGIGIMNTTYTSVLERTQEIGVLKAIGARNEDIAKIFLIESGMLGMVGGLIGIGIGYGVAKIVEIVVTASGNTILQADMTFMLFFGTLAFSFFIGALSGLLPSIQASKLEPTEALRYE